MLGEPRQALLEDILEPVLVNQVNEKVEGNDMVAVQEELPNDEVHSLHVVDLVILAGESPENFTELLVPSLTNMEVTV